MKNEINNIPLLDINDFSIQDELDGLVETLNSYLKLRKYYEQNSSAPSQTIASPIIKSLDKRILQLEYAIALTSINNPLLSNESLLDKIEAKEEIKSYLKPYMNIAIDEYAVIKKLFEYDYIDEIKELLLWQPYNKAGMIYYIYTSNTVISSKQANFTTELLLADKDKSEEQKDMNLYLFVNIFTKTFRFYLIDNGIYHVIEHMLKEMINYTQDINVSKTTLLSQNPPEEMEKIIDNMILKIQLELNLVDKNILAKSKI